MKIVTRIVSVAITLIVSGTVYAQKSVYVPNEWATNKVGGVDTLLYKEVDEKNEYTWSLSRSKQSENFVCLWDNKYSKEPSLLASGDDYYVDVDDLLQKAETFYTMNVKTLGFCDEANSNVSRYKMLILINHSKEWICYGSGYDDVIGALWLSPSTCRPVGHSVAHEVGHSFQYMCWVDNGGNSGFRTAIGNGSTYWEQCAQWQANQSYPEEMFAQSWSVFSKTHNYAMTHEWHRYQSYWWNYYLAEKYGIDFIGKLWRYKPTKAGDPNEVFMELMGYDATQLYKEYFDYAMKMATLDLDVCRDKADAYIGTLAYNYVPLGGSKFQVAYSSCPQASGFDVIPLRVPAEGTLIATEFTSFPTKAPLAEGDPVVYYDANGKYSVINKTVYNNTLNYKNRGFRLGYVALLNDGTRVYMPHDEVVGTSNLASSTITANVGCQVPANTKKLFLVVVPTPKAYYQHKWNETIDKNDQWSYAVEFTNTTILDYPEIEPGRNVCDATIEYDVYFAPSATKYDGTTVSLSGEALAALGTAFQQNASGISKMMEAWKSTAPTEGKMAFFAVNADGNIANSQSTANGYGHWFTANGNVTNWGNNSYVFSEFDPSTLTFSVGQYPGLLAKGKDYKLTQALRYKLNGQIATVTFVFNIHVTSDKSGASLARTTLTPLETTGVTSCLKEDVLGNGKIYDLSGKEVKDCQHNGTSGKMLVDGKIRIKK
ncbi:MAG: DUF4859 domain-containing protein [Bacteroidaceae bacterium]|nr:DUF4859 domain-containing protein [Bacteroidaceae bacterium]